MRRNGRGMDRSTVRMLGDTDESNHSLFWKDVEENIGGAWSTSTSI